VAGGIGLFDDGGPDQVAFALMRHKNWGDNAAMWWAGQVIVSEGDR
jgi:hypothetical protein